MNRELLRDSWQRILPLAPWLKARGCWLCLHTLTCVDATWLVCKYWWLQPKGAKCLQAPSRMLLVTSFVQNIPLLVPAIMSRPDQETKGQCNSSLRPSIEGQLTRWHSQTVLGGGRWCNKKQRSQIVACQVKNDPWGRCAALGQISRGVEGTSIPEGVQVSARQSCSWPDLALAIVLFWAGAWNRDFQRSLPTKYT